MPEGPEIETVRRQLSALLPQQRLGKVSVSPHRLRWPANAQQLNQLTGRTVQSLHAHGKLLWLQLDTQEGLFVRLGMSGSMHAVSQQQTKKPHTHVCIDLMGTDQQLRYVDPRRFGGVWAFSSQCELQNTLQQLGPDPLRWNNTQQHSVLQQMQHSTRCIKNLLLDQKVIAGIGNIYACEALFAAKLSPFVPACHYGIEQLTRLLQCVQRTLHRAVAHQGTTFRLYRTVHEHKGQFAQQLQVFQREGSPCFTCTQPITRMVQAGRSTFLCTFCQCDKITPKIFAPVTPSANANRRHLKQRNPTTS
ncbi:MAG: bifunctional DNA-formamidopyrimidine glycosylase/DNA-(apurinic or apyrimidinic site) lyase [Myxococcota bacterium]